MYQNWELDDAVRSMVRRAQLKRVDDSGSQQLVDLIGLYNDKPKKVFRPQQHGFTSNPPTNSEGLLLALGGRSDRVVYLDGGHKDYRPTGLQSGETCLYDAFGKKIKIFKDAVTVDAGGKPVTITNATKVTIQGTTDVAFGVGGTWVHATAGMVFLGVSSADATDGNLVQTVAGPATKVKAV